MNLRRFYAIGGLVLVLEVALTAWGLSQVGSDAIVPIHWNVNGVADGFASAGIAFLIGPAVTALIIGLMAVVPRIEPRRENLRRSADAYRTMAITLVAFLAVIHAVTVFSGLGVDVPVGTIVGGGVGILFAIIGNVLTTVRSNFMFGVRTPWTLTSERSWDRTHRLVGRLLVVTGLLMVAAALTGQLVIVMGVMLVMLVVILAGGTWYSYRVWRTDPERRPTGGAA
jgi:uncharacterized membrane protein